MNLQGIFFSLIIFFIICVGTVSADNKPAISHYSEAVSLFHKAIKNYDSSSIEQAIKLFDAIIDSNPGDARALIYKGSLLSALAKTSWMPWNKLAYLNNGVDLMDKGMDMLLANKTDPHIEIEMRMVRGITSAKIPNVFKRGNVAATDFKMIRENTNFHKMSLDDKSTVLSYSAVLAHRVGENNKAEQFLKEAQALNLNIADAIWREK